jgi:peptide/nickel transport system substrate-binding protein
MIRWLALTVGVIAALVVLTEAAAWASWSWSGAGTADLAAVLAKPSPDRMPSAARDTHRLATWTADRPRAFQQAPMLDGAALPPVADRLPNEPLVIVPPEREGPYGGTLNRAVTSLSEPLRIVVEWLFTPEPLVKASPDGRELWPNLATAWEVSPDATTYTLHLRRGVRWSDGEPFTSADVRFWFDDIVHGEGIGTSLPEPFAGARLETPDAYTLIFRFAQPWGQFLQSQISGVWGTEMVNTPRHHLAPLHPAHAPKAQLEAAAVAAGFPSWRERFDAARDWRSTTCPRLWPWLMKLPPPAHTTVVLERNPYYWKVDPAGRQLPYLDRVTFTLTDPEAIVLQAINGDLAVQDRLLPPAAYPLLMAGQAQGRYQIRHWIGNDSTIAAVIMLNHNHPDPVMRSLLADARFSRALSLAIDRDEINRIIFRGQGVPRALAPADASPFANPEQAKAWISHDPTAAGRMLDELGCPMGSDGVRRRPDGTPFFLTIDNRGVDGPVSQLVAEHWTRIGVRTVGKTMARTLYYDRKAASVQDAIAADGGMDMNPTLAADVYVPISGESNWGATWAQWFQTKGAAGEEPPGDVRAMMDAYRQIQATSDVAEQRRLFDQILAAHREHPYVIGVVALPMIICLVRDDVRNVPAVAATGWQFRAPSNLAPECWSLDATRATASAASATAAVPGGR